MKINRGNLDVIGGIASNIGKKLRNTKFQNLNKTNDITFNIYTLCDFNRNCQITILSILLVKTSYISVCSKAFFRLCIKKEV